MNRVAYYIISDGIGGAEQVVLQTLKSFENNHNFFIIINNEIFNQFKNVVPENKILNLGDVYIHTKKKYRCVRYFLNNRFYNFRRFIVKSKTNKILKFCKLNEIKIIHTHLDYALISAIKIKNESPNIKLIHTVHGAFGLLNDSKLKPDVQIQKIDHLKIDFLIFVANYLAILYKKNRVQLGKNSVIYNGLEKNVLYNSKPKLINKNIFRILFVGGSKYVKGYDILIETIVKLIKNNFNNFHVTVLGPLSVDCEIEKLIQKNSLESYFSLIGFINPPKHLNYFNESDVLFMPSRSEALPMAAIEAVFCNLPVIASNVGGISEVIIHENNGQLCEIKSEQFCEAIINLANNYNQLHSSYSAFNLTHQNNFDIHTINSKLFDIYKKI
ncbi:MAG: glycosyltransferase [Bacteroidota bacterium]|nr:glycosyltransferase [Bacteroidota bacterium]MDP3144346.1 glycosyltransferase [Bacteroidota bacterium]